MIVMFFSAVNLRASMKTSTQPVSLGLIASVEELTVLQTLQEVLKPVTLRGTA
jgi:hypothetical protein